MRKRVWIDQFNNPSGKMLIKVYELRNEKVSGRETPDTRVSRIGSFKL